MCRTGAREFTEEEFLLASASLRRALMDKVRYYRHYSFVKDRKVYEGVFG